MGTNGDQDINWSQNATLAGCEHNGVDGHLFEVSDAGEYIYYGRINLC
jgi:HNH endonuclease